MNDSKLEKKVRKVLRKYPYKISVRVRDGVVFLSGKVKNYSEWVDIGLAVGRVKGVEGVVNNLEWEGMPKDKIEAKWKRRKEIFEKMKDKVIGEFDVVVIGAGVIGSMIARELARYDIRVALVEKNADVGEGVTKANNGMIHSGVEAEGGTLKAKLNVKGNAMYDRICEELGVRFKRIGGLWLITRRTLERHKIRKILRGPLYTFFLKYVLPYLIVLRARSRGVRGVKVLRGKKLFEEEPNITREALAGVLVPTVGILDPYELTYALVENAVANGVKLFLETEVVGFLREGDRIVGVVTTRGTLRSKVVVNAAGLYADEVAEMAGAREYTIHPRKGVIVLFDRELSGYVRHAVVDIILPRPERTKGGNVNPTIHGNIIWGPTAEEVPDKEDTSVSREDVKAVLDRYGYVVPNFPKNRIIRYFAGVRPASFTEDFIIRPAKWVRGFIHVAGMQSPGLASAPAVGEMVRDLVLQELRRLGVEVRKRKNFNPRREPIRRMEEMSDEELDDAIKKDPRWGRVICFCEGVTEAEIVEAIRRGARTLDAIKRWTRAGMGTCQGQMCMLEVARILARELGIPMEQVTKKGLGSELFVGKVKQIKQKRRQKRRG